MTSLAFAVVLIIAGAITSPSAPQTAEKASPKAVSGVAPAAVPRDRCDSTEIDDDVGSFLYKEAPVEQVSQAVKPKAAFSAGGRIICVQDGSLGYPRKIEAYQVESGVHEGFGYRINYHHAYARVTESGKQDDILSDEYWSVNCDTDNMTDKVSCYINQKHLFIWYYGGKDWRVHIGDGSNYPASDIAVRFGDAGAIQAKEPSFSIEQSRRIVEQLKAEPRVRTRFYKWPSGIGEDDFQAKGFNVALALVKWLHGEVRP